MVAALPDEDEDEDGDEPETPTKSVSRRRISMQHKRTRRLSGDSVTKMTKAEVRFIFSIPSTLFNISIAHSVDRKILETAKVA